MQKEKLTKSRCRQKDQRNQTGSRYKAISHGAAIFFRKDKYKAHDNAAAIKQEKPNV
jgi:hypothetical protein